jgi:fumarate hydratase class II
MMQVMIGALDAFTQKCVVGLVANDEKAQYWLAKNAIVVTALNPLIGYSQGAELVKEALERNITIRQIAAEKVESGELRHREESRGIRIEEIDEALDDLRRLTEGGIVS